MPAPRRPAAFSFNLKKKNTLRQPKKKKKDFKLTSSQELAPFFFSLPNHKKIRTAGEREESRSFEFLVDDQLVLKTETRKVELEEEKI